MCGQSFRKTYEKIKSLIPSEPIDEKIDADDGDAWSFDAYNEDGKLVFTRPMDYIYGIRPLEKLGFILCLYVPHYEDPTCEQEAKYNEYWKKKDAERIKVSVADANERNYSVRIPDFLK